MIKFGVVHQESKDKGPYKLGQAMADGKVMDVEFCDLTGMEGSPLKDSRCIILSPDGDDGKAVAIVFGPAVKDRTDGQKPGEVTYKNHKSGTQRVFKDGGDEVVTIKKDQMEEIKGKQTIKADGQIKINGAKLLLNC